MPLQRRIPKRGFNNYVFATRYATVNIQDLNRFQDGAVVDASSLTEIGLIKKTLDGVKVLGKGDLNRKLTVNVNAFSQSAKEKIETAGGKAEVI
jgi:large subunit ribosomal protein L15